MICKLISLTPKPGKEKELESLLVSMLQPSQNEPGCLEYRLLKMETSFTFIEKWESEEHLNAHKQTDHFLRFKNESANLVESKSSESFDELK